MKVISLRFTCREEGRYLTAARQLLKSTEWVEAKQILFAVDSQRSFLAEYGGRLFGVLAEIHLVSDELPTK